VVDRIVADSPEPVRLGGISHQIARQIEEATDIECRVAQLGHLQRGGTPSSADRILATRLAVKSMELVAEGTFNHMVATKGEEIVAVPIERVMGRQKFVPRDSPLIEAALSIGASLGVDL